MFSRWLPFKRRRTDADAHPHTTNDTTATVTVTTSTSTSAPALPAAALQNLPTTPSAALVLGQPIIPHDEFNALSTSRISPPAAATRTRSATAPALTRRIEPPPPVYSRPPSPHLSPPPRPSPRPGASFNDKRRRDSPPAAPGVLPTPDEEYNTFGRAARLSLSAVRPSSSMSAVRSSSPTALIRASSSTPPSAFATAARHSDPTNARTRPALADARLSMTPSTSNSSHGSPLPKRSASLQEHERQRERARRRRRLRASATGSMGAISGAAVLAEGRVDGGDGMTRSNTSSSSASSPSIWSPRGGRAHAAEPSVPFTFGFAHGRRARMRGGMGSGEWQQQRQNSADSAMSAGPLSAMQEQAPDAVTSASGGHEPATRPEADSARDSHEASGTDSPGADAPFSSPIAHDPSDLAPRAAAAHVARPAHTRLLDLFSASAAAASPSSSSSRDSTTAPAQALPLASADDSADSPSPYQAIVAALEPSSSALPESPLRPPVLPRPPSPAHSTASRGSRASRFTEMLDDSRVSVLPASPAGVSPLRPSDAANRPPRVAKRRHSDLGAGKPAPRKTRVSILSGGGHDRPGFEFSVTPPTMERIHAAATDESPSTPAAASMSKSEGKRKASDPESVDSMGRIRAGATGKRPHTASGATAPSTSGQRSAKRVRLSAPGPSSSSSPPTRHSTPRHRGESSGSTGQHLLTRSPSRASTASKRTSRSIPVRAIVSPRPGSIAGSTRTYHMRDPHLPPPPPVGWRPVSMVSETLDEEKALGKPEAAPDVHVKRSAPWTAWAFYIGFVLFPLWWIAALAPVRAWPPRDRRDWDGWLRARDERAWRNRNRWMSVLGLILYVPVIVLAAVFGMHATITDIS